MEALTEADLDRALEELCQKDLVTRAGDLWTLSKRFMEIYGRQLERLSNVTELQNPTDKIKDPSGLAIVMSVARGMSPEKFTDHQVVAVKVLMEVKLFGKPPL